MSIKFECTATAIGSFPHTDPVEASKLILRHFKSIPFWPQLPKRHLRENMYAQFGEGFPGFVIEEQKIRIDKERAAEQLEQFYQAYLDNNFNYFSISNDFASGLHHMLNLREIRTPFIKGHITGPFSWGLTLTDRGLRSIIYDDELGEAVTKHLKMKAAWQEAQLRLINKNTIIFIDEPYMASFGSAFIPITSERFITMINEVLRGINGIKGIHCCGNTDWSVLLNTELDVLSFDTYNYSTSLSLYPEKIKGFLQHGGNIAWGIIPNEEDLLLKESLNSLKDRLEEAISSLTKKGINFRSLIEQSLFTPCCGLAGLTPDGAENAIVLLTELSDKFRKRYIM